MDNQFEKAKHLSNEVLSPATIRDFAKALPSISPHVNKAIVTPGEKGDYEIDVVSNNQYLLIVRHATLEAVNRLPQWQEFEGLTTSVTTLSTHVADLKDSQGNPIDPWMDTYAYTFSAALMAWWQGQNQQSYISVHKENALHLDQDFEREVKLDELIKAIDHLFTAIPGIHRFLSSLRIG